MTALAGEIADGMITHPTNTPPRYVREVVLPGCARRAEARARPGELQAGAGLAGRNRTGHGERGEGAREMARMLGFLYSTPAYWPSLELFGWQDRGSSCSR